MKKVFFVILIIMLIATAGAGAYFWQQRTIDDLRAANDTLTSKVKQLEADLNKQDSASSNSDNQQPAATTYTSEKGVKVILTSPAADTKVTSPLAVTGSVPGSWSFEAQFSVRLIDAQGNLLDEAPAKLQGDWMTDSLVPFTATLQFGTGASQKGTLVLIKSNQSGLAANNDSVVIPVTF